MTIIRHLSELAAAVMPGVVADFASLYPAAPAVSWDVSTRALAEHAAPPRVVWVPTRDDFRGAQKRTTGGASLQHSLGTRVAGARAVCWGETIDATEDLAEALVRHLLRAGGSGAEGVSVESGLWVDATGATTLGEDYALSITFPVDVRAQAAAPPARPTVTPVLDTAGAGTPGDGSVDSDDLP